MYSTKELLCCCGATEPSCHQLFFTVKTSSRTIRLIERSTVEMVFTLHGKVDLKECPPSIGGFTVYHMSITLKLEANMLRLPWAGISYNQNDLSSCYNHVKINNYESDGMRGKLTYQFLAFLEERSSLHCKSL